MLDRFLGAAQAARGRVGAVLATPGGNEACALDPDGVYPAASVIKLALVMTLFADDADRRLSADEPIAVGARVDGSGVLRDLTADLRLSLRDMAALAMTVSDNTATNRLIERIGPARVNERLEEWGCGRTRLRRAMFDLEGKARGLENVMTPRETAALLRRVAGGAAQGDTAMREVLRLLERNTDRTRLGRYLPVTVALAHKDGWMDEVDNDAGVVRAEREVIAVGLTSGVAPLVARPLLGLLGAAAAELAGVDARTLSPEALVGT